MPVSSPFGMGGFLSAAATANIRQTMTLSADAPVSTEILVTDRMPHLFFWFNQTVGAPLATVRMQFSVRADPAGGNLDEWLDIQPPTLLVAGPNRFNFQIPAVKSRALVTRSPGVASTVEVVLGASAS